MSTILHQTSTEVQEIPLASDDFSCVIVTADWNSEITYPLRDGAVETLRKAGVKDDKIRLLSVPGAVELVFGASMAIKKLKPSAVIVIGCVIRGDTPHFDYVCQSVTQGVTTINAEGHTPVIFSVLTVNTLEQALERCGGKLGNKGADGALTALKMAQFL